MSAKKDDAVSKAAYRILQYEENRYCPVGWWNHERLNGTNTTIRVSLAKGLDVGQIADAVVAYLRGKQGGKVRAKAGGCKKILNEELHPETPPEGQTS